MWGYNAMSNADDGWVAPNQTLPMKRQLEDGIRAMLIDTYSNLGTTYHYSVGDLFQVVRELNAL